MNPLNYASLEASKRLAEAGIVLETEQYHTIETYEDSQVWCEVPTEGTDARPRPIKIKVSTTFPAPSMAEVWRELPPQGCYLTANQGYYYAWIEWTDFEGHGKSYEAKENTNPTDALISLLIWVRKENNAS